jgi:predicted 3-demethylubiquinone-9 3-methyltransferase (glyoxalase superfamily)
MAKVSTYLNFTRNTEEAAIFYTTIFNNSKIESISHYGKEGFEIHGQKEGALLTVGFRINGQPFTALNAGPVFKFSEAISFQVFCETQEEIDYYWEKISVCALARKYFA